MSAAARSGMAFAKDGALLCCVGGMGLYRIGIGPAGDQADRRDQSRRPSRSSTIRACKLADDLDIAPDGRVFFSEATIRYEMHDWAGGLPGIAAATAASSATTRTTEDHAHRAAQPDLPERHLHGA